MRAVKWDKYAVIRGKLPLRLLFLSGFVAGVMIVCLKRNKILQKTGLLEEDTLYQLKYMTVDSSALFWRVLWTRGRECVMLGIMATTYLGLAACSVMTIRYGWSMGFFLSTAMLRYGVKGMLLGIVTVFPHYLVYVPLMVRLLRCCEDIHRRIYFYQNTAGQGKRSLPGSIGRAVLLFAAFLLGCALESYVNPVLLQGFLKFF